MSIYSSEFIYKQTLNDAVIENLSSQSKPLMEDSWLNGRVHEIYKSLKPIGINEGKLKSAIKSKVIEHIGRNAVADVRETLFSEISPEHQRLIFDLFDQGSGKNLKENMKHFLNYSKGKPVPIPLGDTIALFEAFHTRITKNDMPSKLKILKNMEEKAPELLKEFTKEEWKLIHSINHTH